MKITVVMLWTTFVKIPDNDSCQILPSPRIYLGLKLVLRMFRNDREGQTPVIGLIYFVGPPLSLASTA